jgi:hypothetical protein
MELIILIGSLVMLMGVVAYVFLFPNKECECPVTVWPSGDKVISHREECEEAKR